MKVFPSLRVGQPEVPHLFNEAFPSLIVVLFVFIYTVVCKDEEGKLLVMKSTMGWIVSRCLRCLCIEGLVTCKRTLTVFFPAFFDAAYQHEETCKQPTCNILEFVRNNKKWCEGKNFVRPELNN